MRLRTRGGFVGYGDCAPLRGSGTETLSRAKQALRQILGACAGRDWRWFEHQSRRWLAAPAALAAVETAFLDVLAQQAGVPVSLLMNPAGDGVVAVNGSLGPADNGACARADEAVEAGYRVLKLKMGMTPLASELEWIRELQQRLPRGVGLRLDANGAWSFQQAVIVLDALGRRSIDALEEPLSDPDPASLGLLQHRVPWPLALDESLPRMVGRCHAYRLPVRRIVIKVPVYGGIRSALGMAERAYAQDVEVVVTTLADNAVGRLAALHCAAALKHPAVHGLATHDWFREDVGWAPRPRWGALAVPAIPGLGFSPDPALRFYTVS